MPVKSLKSGYKNIFDEWHFKLQRLKNLHEIYKKLESDRINNNKVAGKSKAGKKPLEHKDLLRGIVVLLHASFESTIRELYVLYVKSNWRSDVKVREGIQFPGKRDFGTVEKLTFSDLVGLRCETLSELADRSIDNLQGRQLINGIPDLISVLTDMGITIPSSVDRSAIGEWITKRHRIVHHGDRVDGAIKKGQHKHADFKEELVQKWIGAASQFMESLRIQMEGKAAFVS